MWKNFRPFLALLMVWSIGAIGRAQTLPESAPRQTGLDLRNRSQMTAQDSQVVLQRTQDIAHSAEFYGYSLDSSWTYQQTLCPIAPNHVLLNYTRTEANGSLSNFSAVVPRQSGVVEIFPILRSGISPFAQQWGEHSYAVFNRLVAQERIGMKRLDMSSAFSMPWKDLALCYVALVTTPEKNAQAPFQLASEVTVSIHDRGQPDVGFTASDTNMSYSNWSLKFSSNGLLLKAFRDQHSVLYTPDPSADPSLPKPKVIPDSQMGPPTAH